MNFNANAFRSGRIEKKLVTLFRWRLEKYGGVLVSLYTIQYTGCPDANLNFSIFVYLHGTSIPTEFSL